MNGQQKGGAYLLKKMRETSVETEKLSLLHGKRKVLRSPLLRYCKHNSTSCLLFKANLLEKVV